MASAPPSTCIPPELAPASGSSTSTATHPDTPPSIDPSTSTPTSAPAPSEHATSSIFSRSETAPVHLVPMSVIRRPLPSELDEEKVRTFMAEMQAGDTFTPIELIKVRAPLRSNPAAGPQVFYFSMGGCHRYEATKRLGLESIRARIIEVPASQIRVYLGAGSPF